jgi:iron-sulfur cluster assembly protein
LRATRSVAIERAIISERAHRTGWSRTMSIQLSESAAARVSGYLNERPDAVGLRFGVRKTGCSGFAYVVDLTSSVAENDRVFESRGVKVFVDPDSLPLIDGTEIDYAREGLNSQFVFRNPNVSGECGCGESFTVT